MFRSATFKLTTWYLTILVAISLLFSIIIYSISASELRSRIGSLQHNAPLSLNINQTQFGIMREVQVHEAEANLLFSLAVTNVSIWLAGGIGSYYLARRSLRPIEEAHEAQSRFTSDASHELRTPLASMKTELEVALRDPALTKNEMRELLTSNLEEVNKLAAMSQTLLQLSRLDHANITRENITLDTIARSVIERFPGHAERVRLSGKKTHKVIANKSSIEELMTILLDNALKYSPADSTVTITLIGQKNMAGFEVANDGQGISSEALPHIFDRFYRVDMSRTGGENKGYGLGLSLAKKIVELNNGELSVTSGADQKTVFRVLLPNLSKHQALSQ